MLLKKIERFIIIFLFFIFDIVGVQMLQIMCRLDVTKAGPPGLCLKCLGTSV